MRVIACIPVHLASKRLPRKILMEIADKSLLQHTIEQVGKATRISKIVVCMTTDKEDDELYKYARGLYDVGVYRGDPTNIISRLVRVAEMEKADIIVNVDGEQPRTDARLLDKAIEVIELGYPFAYIGGVKRGLGGYAIRVDYLNHIYQTKDCNTDEQWYKLFEVEDDTCVDTQEDFDRIKNLMEKNL